MRRTVADVLTTDQEYTAAIAAALSLGNLLWALRSFHETLPPERRARVLEEDELHVESVFLLPERRGVRVHAAVEHDARRVAAVFAPYVEQGYDVVWPVIRGVWMGPDVAEADYRRWNEFDKADDFIDPALRETQALSDLERERFKQVQVTGYEVRTSSEPAEGEYEQVVEIRMVNRHTQAEKMLLDAQPVIPLATSSTNWMKKPYVKGMSPNPVTLHAWKFVYIEHDPSKW